MSGKQSSSKDRVMLPEANVENFRELERFMKESLDNFIVHDKEDLAKLDGIVKLLKKMANETGKALPWSAGNKASLSYSSLTSVWPNLLKKDIHVQSDIRGSSGTKSPNILVTSSFPEYCKESTMDSAYVTMDAAELITMTHSDYTEEDHEVFFLAGSGIYILAKFNTSSVLLSKLTEKLEFTHVFSGKETAKKYSDQSKEGRFEKEKNDVALASTMASRFQKKKSQYDMMAPYWESKNESAMLYLKLCEQNRIAPAPIKALGLAPSSVVENMVIKKVLEDSKRFKNSKEMLAIFAKIYPHRAVQLGFTVAE